MILTYTVLAAEEGQKVSNILRNKLNVSSRLLTKLKMNEKILVNDVPVFSSHIVKNGDFITVKIDLEEEDYIIEQINPEKKEILINNLQILIKKAIQEFEI